MYYFVYKHLSNKNVSKREQIASSFMELSRLSDLSAADWLSQKHMRNYHNFSRVEVPFSAVEISIKHSILYSNHYNRTPLISYVHNLLSNCPLLTLLFTSLCKHSGCVFPLINMTCAY